MNDYKQKSVKTIPAFLFSFLVFSNFLSISTYGIPFAFYPSLSFSKGVSSTVTGIIFAMFPFGSLISSILMGKTLHRFNKKYCLIISQILVAFSFMFLGLGYYVEDQVYFILLGIFSRIMQGLSIGSFSTSLYSLVPDYWPNEIQKRIGLLEMSSAIGIGIGPVIGAGLYYMDSYILIYLTPSSAIFFCGAVISPFILPIKNSQEIKKTHHLSLIKTYFNKNVMITLWVVILNYGNLTFLMPIFENHIIDMGGDSTLAAILIGISQVGYLAGVSIILFLKTEKRKNIFAFALILNIVSCSMLAFPNYYQIAFGMLILGASNSFTIIPDIPENIEFLREIFKNEEEGLISDMASGIYITAISFAEFYGPILGGVMNDLISFKYSMFFYSGTVFVFLIYYLWFRKRAFKKLPSIPGSATTRDSLATETSPTKTENFTE